MASKGLFMRALRDTGSRAITFLRSPGSWDYQKLAYPFYYMFHPFNAAYDMKYRNRGSVGLANIIVFLFFITAMIEESSTGFIFNFQKPESLDGWIVLLRTVILILLWSVSNWSLCTLMDGEGKFHEIWIFSAYSMMPAVLLTIPKVLLSNFLTLEESSFLTIASAVITGWCVLLLLIAVMYVQQYTLKKTIFSALFTVFGIFAIIFLVVLLFSLFQQFYMFLGTIYQEITFR